MMVSLKTVCRAFVWMLSWFYCCTFGQIWLYFWPVINISWNHCMRIMGGATDKNRGPKSEINFVGLTNQGATCYLNTLLQTWFMTREVKDCINRSQTQDRLIYELKNLFEQLESENDHAVCTKSLTSYLELNGNCSVHKQCDIEVCFRSLMSKLSTQMDKENNILKIYQVTMVHSMKCSKCKIPLDKENLFLDIPLSMCSATSFVKFKCMEESLQEFLIEETMEGDNKCYCDICEEKTESTSRYYFKKLPQILTFQLKRFEFDCYCMQYRKIEDCINLPSDLVFNKSQDDYNEWRPVNKEHLGSNKRCYDALEGGQGSFSTQQLQNGTSKDSCGGRTSEEAQDQSEQDSTEQNLKKQKMLNMEMEDREISVGNIDVQEQLKIKEEVSTSIKESNAQYNHSLEAMKRGQSEISPLQGQNEYSVNGEGRMTEAAPGQSEQDTTEDKESNAQYNDSFKGMERGQSEILPLQGQEEYSVNAERRMTEAAPGQSEQDSTEDKKRDMEHREISVDNIDVQGQLKIKEEVSTSVKVDESPGQPGIYPRLPREESNAQYNDSFKAMEQTQSEISSLQGQEEYSVNAEGRMTEAAPVQSEQDSTEDKKGNTEHREISVDNIDVQGQLKIKEEVSTSVKVDESPGQPEIYPRLPREESNAQYNDSFKGMERGQSEILPLQGQEEYSVNAERRMIEAAPGQSEQDSTEDKKRDMEHREISVDNIDVQGQLKIKEEVSTSVKVDESPGQPGIYPRLPREESNAQYNDSFKAMEQTQSEISSLQGQEEYSVNAEGRMTEAAPVQSEQDSTEDKKGNTEHREISVDNIDVQGQLKIKEEVSTSVKVDESPGQPEIYPRLPREESNAQYNDSFKGMERGQSEILPLQGQEEYSVNAERRMIEAAPGQSEQDSTEDKKRDMEHREISVDNIDVQGQLKIKEEVSTSVKVDESPGQPGIYPRLPREESNAQYNDSFKAMEQTQSEISSLQGQEEYSVNAEGRMTEAAPGQSEQDSTEDKKRDMEHREISVDNIDVQGQLKIKEEVSTSVKVDESPGQPGIYPRLPREESNAQYNDSFKAMEQTQSEISSLQGQEEYSVNAEGRMTEAAPVQSEQDSTEDKKGNTEHREISVDNIDVQGQLKIKEEVSTSVKVDESPGQPEIYPMLPREESNAQYNDSFKGMERGQSEILPLQGQEEYSVNAERRMTEAAPGQSEQDSTEDKEKKYELFAIWHHRGSYGGGHYIAEIKSGSGDWYSFDDRFVKKIGKNINLRSTTAYMVMYRLVDTNKETGSDATTPEQCQAQNPYPEYQNGNEQAENYVYI